MQLDYRARHERANQVRDVGVVRLDRRLRLPLTLQPRRKAVDGIVIGLKFGIQRGVSAESITVESVALGRHASQRPQPHVVFASAGIRASVR